MWFLTSFLFRFILYIYNYKNCKLISETENKRKNYYERKRTDSYNRFPIIQLSLKMEPIREWESACEIELVMGFDKNSILRCCKGKQHKGYWFIWKFKKDVTEEILKILNSNGSNSKEVSGVI